jgi:DNA-binding MltR family transcriptional regulator
MHASFVLVTVSAVDRWLQAAILKKMIPMSKTMVAHIFDGYGPLSQIASKIDICYALRIIDAVMYEELKTLNKIRVKFAHSPVPVSLTDDDMLHSVRSLQTNTERDYTKIGQCQATIKEVVERLIAHLVSQISSP